MPSRALDPGRGLLHGTADLEVGVACAAHVFVDGQRSPPGELEQQARSRGAQKCTAFTKSSSSVTFASTNRPQTVPTAVAAAATSSATWRPERNAW